MGTLLLLLTLAAGPSTTNNDDSCDVGLYPAATLLLPYFEVETQQRAVDTLFTVTNTTNLPQIAHVTVWTDWSYPVLSFNLFLTGYDVQAISLYDVIVNGIVAPSTPNLTAGGTSSNVIPGPLSSANNANPNLSIAQCGTLPGVLDPAVRQALISSLVTGLASSACGAKPIGSPSATHRTFSTAVGYVTIDVTSRCSPTLPTDPSYFANEILYDNVLTGDYATLDRSPGSNYAGGNPLVHIRAIPEGGPAGGAPLVHLPVTNLPYTFYGRFINGQSINGVPLPPHFDRRQPLASSFVTRFIQGGSTSLATDIKIWREGIAGPTTCANVSSNSLLPVPEVVRFDEHENPMTFNYSINFFPITSIILPATSRSSSASTSAFPPMNSPSYDTAGWIYLRLDSGKSDQTINTLAHPSFPAHRPSQNWVTVSMTGAGSTAGLFGVEFDATALGNGCSPAAAMSWAYGGTVPIGPAPNTNP